MDLAPVLFGKAHVRKHVEAAGQRGEKLGLTDDEVAFYDAFAANGSAVKVMGDAKLKVIATELITKVRTSVTIDWTLRGSARAKIRVIVKRILDKFGYPPDMQDETVKTVLMQAELLQRTPMLGMTAMTPVWVGIDEYVATNNGGAFSKGAVISAEKMSCSKEMDAREQLPDAF
jgi:hypothetical protein